MYENSKLRIIIKSSNPEANLGLLQHPRWNVGERGNVISCNGISRV